MSLTKVSYSMITGAPINVMDYGASSSASAATNSTAIQKALDYAATLVPDPAVYNYATVCVELTDPYYNVNSVTIPSGVGLISTGICQLRGQTAGIIVDTTVYSSGTVPHYSGMLKGVHVLGLGAGTAINGVRINNAQNFVVENCRAYNLAGYGFQIQSKWTGSAFTGTATSNTCVFKEARAFSCCLNVASRIGAFDIGGTDHEFIGCETFSLVSRTGSGAGTKYQVAWRLFGASECRFIVCKGSQMDQGWYIDANSFMNFFSACRADTNFYEGVYIDGNINQFDLLDLNGNCIAATNTYDQVVFTSNSTRNHIVSGYCSSQNNGITIVAKYSVTDNGVDSANCNKIGPMFYMKDAGTAPVNNAGNCLSIMLPDNPPVSLSYTSGGTVTPSIINGNQLIKDWKTASSSGTSISTFTGGFKNLLVTVQGDDPNTTILNGSGINTTTGASITMGSNRIAAFKYNGSIWIQVY